jgi:hypothetical protein
MAENRARARRTINWSAPLAIQVAITNAFCHESKKKAGGFTPPAFNRAQNLR